MSGAAVEVGVVENKEAIILFFVLQMFLLKEFQGMPCKRKTLCSASSMVRTDAGATVTSARLA